MLLPGTVAMIPLTAWSIILRDPLLVFFGLVAAADLIVMEMKHYTIGWPGSRLGPYRSFPRVRFSRAQGLLAGLVFIVGTLGAQLVLGPGRKELVLGLGGLLSAVWLFRFLRAMRKEGWRGKKGDVPPARA